MRRRNGQNQSSFITNNNNNRYNGTNGKSKFANRSQGNLMENNEKINEMDEYDNNEHKQASSFSYELSIHEPGDPGDQATSSSSSPKNYDNVIKSRENERDDQHEEKIDVVINKDFRFKDFGFTIAEGLYGHGIYVHKIREGSPADSNYFLKPMSKIYKINNFDCTKIESTAPALKIMANETSNFIRLTISKRPKMNVLLNEDKSSANSSRATAL